MARPPASSRQSQKDSDLPGDEPLPDKGDESLRELRALGDALQTLGEAIQRRLADIDRRYPVGALRVKVPGKQQHAKMAGVSVRIDVDTKQGKITLTPEDARVLDAVELFLRLAFPSAKD